MFKRKLKLFKISYRAIYRTYAMDGYTIVAAKDEIDVVNSFYAGSEHQGCDITKIERYEVEKIDG